MNQLKIRPIRRLDATWTLPGDKSISHRAVFFGALADGTTRIDNFLPSHDCLNSLQAMQALGARTESIDSTTLLVHGLGGRLRPCQEPIDCGNSGTTMRLLSGIVAGHPFTTKLFGDASLHRRPMKRIADPLTRMGARIECGGPNHRPPLTIHGAQLTGITFDSPVASAQLKSCLLLAGLHASGRTTVREPEASRDHTERMLMHFGASMERKPREVSVLGGQRLHAAPVIVPGDFSSAAFWLVAASAFPGARLRLLNVGLNPTRTALLNVLSRMGALFKENVRHHTFEPRGELLIPEGSVLRGTTVGGPEIPNLIDEIPVLAVAAALAQGETVIRDAAELRVKESDRLATITANLRAFGVPVEELPDGLIIQGGHPLHGARVHSHGDHRIAMSCAILGLFAEGETVVEDTECILTSYPSFPEHLAQVLKASPSAPLRFRWPKGKAKAAKPSPATEQSTSGIPPSAKTSPTAEKSKPKKTKAKDHKSKTKTTPPKTPDPTSPIPHSPQPPPPSTP